MQAMKVHVLNNGGLSGLSGLSSDAAKAVKVSGSIAEFCRTNKKSIKHSKMALKAAAKAKRAMARTGKIIKKGKEKEKHKQKRGAWLEAKGKEEKVLIDKADLAVKTDGWLFYNKKENTQNHANCPQPTRIDRSQ
jgi:hypothetical protein